MTGEIVVTDELVESAYAEMNRVIWSAKDETKVIDVAHEGIRAALTLAFARITPTEAMVEAGARALAAEDYERPWEALSEDTTKPHYRQMARIAITSALHTARTAERIREADGAEEE